MRKQKYNAEWIKRIAMSEIFTVATTLIVILASVVSFSIFVRIYRNATEEDVVTSSEQAVVQVRNMVSGYIKDMSGVMDMIHENIGKKERYQDEFLENLLEVRTDIIAITTYDSEGRLLDCWSGGYEVKKNYLKNLSYDSKVPKETAAAGQLYITKPHVESLFVDYYPWVVTISQYMQRAGGEYVQVAIDIKFSNIARYVDDVGIGQHGYCYIMNHKGGIVYHPQQQLIYSGLKEERYATILKEGTQMNQETIYAVEKVENCDWLIVGVSYVDEMITSRVEKVVHTLMIIIPAVILAAFLAGSMFSRIFSRPAKRLTKAMGEFEKNTDGFQFHPITGTKEIATISDSFEHMVLQIQRLVEQVRQEEISLRKTELKALQAQINPHFLYNTLDAIAWMCEEERNQDAEEMVNALAKLFRISISKGYELIPIEKEVEHAASYLKIQNYRYKNQFTYQFDVEDECLLYYCNKITLQPIIENAIYHGLDRMVEEGKIRIAIFEDGEDIVFTVEDNGVGMTEEECREILYRETSDRVGIGIKNVNDRIKIYFGEKYGLSIKSELDEGTKVIIRMPKVTERNYVEK